MPEKRIEYLMHLYFSNQITEKQKKELALWIIKSGDDEEISLLLKTAWSNYKPDLNMPDAVSDKILASLFPQKTVESNSENVASVITISHRKNWWKPAMAAASAIILVTAWYEWLKPLPNNAIVKNINPQKEIIVNDIKPGVQKAVLTLSNGSQIILDSASSGLLAQQGNAKVVKLANGLIAYSSNGLETKGMVFNMMSTPNGGMYQLQLPDGTKVWLNSSSSIRYPTQFLARERRVEITGEAYFEVMKNTNSPFIVKINNNAEVKVLGTHFNINAYSNEAEIKTTLLEGAVSISQGNRTSVIKPGQQMQINKVGTFKLVSNADIEEAIAWKNGNFQFNSSDLDAVLRQAARWYDIEIVYSGNRRPDDRFSGRISRAVNLSTLLKWMQWSEVHFKLEGKKLIIQP